MGGSKSKPATQAASTVWDPQANYLTDMYNQAQNMFQQQNANRSWEGDLANTAQQYGMAGQQYGQAGGELNQAMGQYGQAGAGINQGYGMLGQAGNGINQGYGVLGQAAQGFQGLMNPGQNPMSDVYARLAGQQFNEQIMPGLKGDAMLGGGLGNSRAGIAQGLAGARVGQQLQDWNAQLYEGDMNRKLQASQGMGNLGSAYGDLAGRQGQIGSAYGELAGRQGQIGAGMGNVAGVRAGLGDAYGNLGNNYAQLGNLRQQMPWQALQQYAGLLGRPTTLGGASTGAQAGNSGAIGAIAPIAGAVLAPMTGGASLLAASAVTAGANNYYK